VDIDDEFENFWRKVYPTVPKTTTQYRESKRIWFCATDVLYIFMVATIPKMSDAKAEEQLRNLRAQLKEFAQQIAEDKD
jgi:hypothetical protein